MSLLLIGFLSTRRRFRASRSTVTAALWPDKDETKARHCLATAIWRIKAQTGCAMMPVVVEEDALSLSSGIWLDTIAFGGHLRRGQDVRQERKLRAALRLSGEFLEGHTSDWIAIERERLQCAAIDALLALAACYGHRGHWQGAASAARQVVHMEPLREDAHRLLMRAHLESGNPGLALRQFRACERIMALELGIEPMAETRLLAHKVRHLGSRPELSPDHDDLRAALLDGRAALASAAARLDQVIRLL